MQKQMRKHTSAVRSTDTDVVLFVLIDYLCHLAAAQSRSRERLCHFDFRFCDVHLRTIEELLVTLNYSPGPSFESDAEPLAHAAYTRHIK